MSKNYKFCNFWAISTCYTSKESIFHTRFNFKQKNYGLFEGKLKKTNLSIFSVKIYADLLSSIANFTNLCSEVWKLSWSVLWKGFEIKSHQGRAQYLNPSRDGGWIYSVVASRATPSLIRVKVRTKFGSKILEDICFLS